MLQSLTNHHGIQQYKDVFMPRKPRFVLPGEPQHVIIRGVNREPIFYTEQDYRCYLSRLQEAIGKHGCALHAYVLMTNHVHFLISPANEIGIGRMIQMLGRYYVQYFNHTYGRTGTLWEGRYKATLVDTEEYLLTCYRYIELNPVRAQMVEHPADYPWSSYRHNALGQANPILSPHEKYRDLGRTDESRQTSYRALFNAHLSDSALSEIRDATQKEWVLGSDYFKVKIGSRLERKVSPMPRGGDRRSNRFMRNNEINRH